MKLNILVSALVLLCQPRELYGALIRLGPDYLASQHDAVRLQLSQGTLRGKVGSVNQFVSTLESQSEPADHWRQKRTDEPPISLDLTFHLLREVLELARAEQLARQAHDNRRMMDLFGK